MKIEFTLQRNDCPFGAQCSLCGSHFDSTAPMVAALAFSRESLVCGKCLKEYDPKLSEMIDRIGNNPEYGTPSTKEQLLQKYSTREPKQFAQYDGFKLDGRDDVMNPDESGHSIMHGATYELMRCPAAVRVLIPEKTDKRDAVNLLLKIAHAIECDGIYQKPVETFEVREDGLI